jgi:hypothetical protein
MARVLSEQTAQRLIRLLNSGALGAGRALSGGSARWALVRCDSTTAVGGSDILDQCYPATILVPSADFPAPPEENFGALLTVLGSDGESVKPREGGVYECVVTGEVVGDRDGTKAGRPRAFGVPVAEVATDGGCVGCGWFAGLVETDCLRVTIDGDETEVYLATEDAITWTSEGTVTICASAYTLTVTRPDAGGVPRLSIATGGSGGDEFEGVWNCCGCAFAKWTFPLQELCPDEDETGDPCTNVVEIRVDHSCCPIEGWEGEGWYCAVEEGDDCEIDTPEPVELTDDVKCTASVVICSGPYATEELASAFCEGDPDPIDPVECVGHTFTNVTATVSDRTGACSCFGPDTLERTSQGTDAFEFRVVTGCPENDCAFNTTPPNYSIFALSCSGGNYLLGDPGGATRDILFFQADPWLMVVRYTFADGTILVTYADEA